MKFQPKSQEELDREAAARGPFRPGVYDFDVTSASDETSKNGNEMIAVVLKVYDQDGETRTVRDWLLEAMAYKLRHACETVGLDHEYEAGTVSAADFEGRSGKVKLKIEKSSGFPDKNVVADYVVEAAVLKPAPVQKQMVSADLDDDIPF